MSRLIIKNLPKNLTEDELRQKFSEQGLVTDVQLKFTKDGRFRQFAFVGFSSEEEANRAIDYFNKSFFKSTRITVERCAQLGDENKPKAWSKYAPDSSAYKKLHGITNLKEVNDLQQLNKEKKLNPIVKELSEKLLKLKNDPVFLEYMEVHGKDLKTWNENDINAFLSLRNEKEVVENVRDFELKDDESENEVEEKIAENNAVSDLEYLKLKTGKTTLEELRQRIQNQETSSNKFFTLVVRGIPYKTKKKDIKNFFRPLKIDSIRIPVKIKGLAYVGFKDEKKVKKALLRNKSFIDGKQVYVHYLKDDTNSHSHIIENTKIKDKWKQQEESLKMEENVAESGRIFVRNLPYTTTEDELQRVFENFGPITEVIVPLDKVTRKLKGYGVITFLIPEHAVKAYTELDGTIFHGRMLHLLPGKPKESIENDVKDKSSFKTKKLQILKAEAGSSYNWNTLFLGQNAVADVMSSTYNTSKENILSGNNVAVRLALGETQLVHETKEFLEYSGVKLDAFNRVVNHRSKNIILVKNLPAGIQVSEIRELFSKYGVLGRVLLPPSGITSIVEFIEPAEARTAFRRLAYSKFKHLPLYLEWAPEDTFINCDENLTSKSGNDSVICEKSEELYNSDNGLQPEPDTTLFIKNLNFETTEDSIRQHFKECGKIANVTVARKKDPNKPGLLLSMGYGFIQFYHQRSVNNALKTLQQSSLDGHCIELKRSNRTLKENLHIERKINNVEKHTGSKILVRNIPFQAKLNELRELFKVFGDIKALRLPKKMVGTGPHRGFAFVEYHTKEDAKRAMQSLCQSTHLYGRRLVLEWAQSAEEDIEQLRKRTAEHFPVEKETRSKKSTADINIEDSDED